MIQKTRQSENKRDKAKPESTTTGEEKRLNKKMRGKETRWNEMKKNKKKRRENKRQ